MTYGRLLLTGALICLLAFLSAGCATSFSEWSGEMPNETGRHVSPYNVDHQEENNEAIRLIRLTSAERKENQQTMRNSASPAAAVTPAITSFNGRLSAAATHLNSQPF